MSPTTFSFSACFLPDAIRYGLVVRTVAGTGRDRQHRVRAFSGPKPKNKAGMSFAMSNLGPAYGTDRDSDGGRELAKEPSGRCSARFISSVAMPEGLSRCYS